MKKYILFILFLLLGACARPALQEPELPADAIWQKMLAASAERKGSYRIQISMRIGEEGNTRRVTGLLWGNGESEIRLDVMAGVGATIAMISEKGEEFLVYMPRENRAYSHIGYSKPMFKIGVPLPFDLAALASLLNGNYAAVFGSVPVSSKILANGSALFDLDGRLAGKLEVRQDGIPVAWEQENGGWKLQISVEEDKPDMPRKLEFSSQKGQRAIILVKEREAMDRPFDANQLKLDVPSGIEILPLSSFKQP